MSLPVRKPVHGFPQRKILDPVLFPVLFIADLIHHIKSIAPFGIDGFKKTYRILNGVHGVDDKFFSDPDLLCYLRQRRFLQMLLRVFFPGVDCLVGDVPERTAHPDTVIVSQISSDLSDDHGDGVGGKLHI